MLACLGLAQVAASYPGRSHCRFRNRGIEYISESGMKWMSGGTKRHLAGQVAVAEQRTQAAGVLGAAHGVEELVEVAVWSGSDRGPAVLNRSKLH